MAPASYSTLIAQPRSARIAGRRSFVVSIEIALAWKNPSRPSSFRRLAQVDRQSLQNLSSALTS
jgi:hypothetical protein